MDSDKLKGYIKEKRKTLQECADVLGLSLFQFRRKVNGEVGFWLKEMAILAAFLEMPKEKFFEIFMPNVYHKEIV